MSPAASQALLSQDGIHPDFLTAYVPWILRDIVKRDGTVHKAFLFIVASYELRGLRIESEILEALMNHGYLPYCLPLSHVRPQRSSRMAPVL